METLLAAIFPNFHLKPFLGCVKSIRGAAVVVGCRRSSWDRGERPLGSWGIRVKQLPWIYGSGHTYASSAPDRTLWLILPFIACLEKAS